MDGGVPRHVYVHVPFCRARCDYCDFYSVAVGDSGFRDSGGCSTSSTVADERPSDGERGVDHARLPDRLVDAVLAEWELEKSSLGLRERADGRGRGGGRGRAAGPHLHTVYVGGGTPSLLGAARLERLLSAFDALLTPGAEVTVETNPEDVTAGYARWAAGRGLRISLGAQSFQPHLRKALGRRAQADPAAVFRRLREAGCRNVGIDLMFGIPGQTAADLDADLAMVARLRPEHVSWYELDVIVGTTLAARVRRPDRAPCGTTEAEAPLGDAPVDDAPVDDAPVVAGSGPGGLARPDTDARARMYRAVVRGLGRLGYRWYEVSNFALPGRRCRHNGAVWRGDGYLGLGPGAVGTLGGERRRNRPDTEAYVAALAPERGGRPPALPPREVERLTAAERARERLYLAARTGAAVPLRDVQEVLDMAALQSLEEARFVRRAGGTLRMTCKGRYVADEVCVRLFRTVHAGDT